MKIKLLIKNNKVSLGLLIFVIVFSSCASNRYPYRKKRRKKCDCSDWAFYKSVEQFDNKTTICFENN